MQQCSVFTVSTKLVNQTTATINYQKTQIDAWVKAVGTAATIISEITTLVAAVAKI